MTAAPAFQAYVASIAGTEAAAALAAALGVPAEAGSVRAGTLATLARLPGTGTLMGTVVVELGPDRDDAADLAAVTEIAAEVDRLFVIGTADGIGLYRKMRAAGAAEYFALPLDPEALNDLAAAAHTPGPANSAGRQTPVTGVLGLGGGSGASAIAANLAFLLAAGGARRVALVDADLMFGTLCVDLDLMPTKGLLDALLTPARVDRTFLDSSMAIVSPGLQVYAAEARLDEPLAEYEAGLAELVDQLRLHFDHVVIDLPRSTLNRNAPLLATLDHGLLVMTPGFAPVRAFGRAVQRLEQIAPGLDLRCVLSGTRRDAALTRKEIGTAIGCDIACQIPGDAAGFGRAAVQGRLIASVAPRGPFTRALRRLSAELAAPIAAQSVRPPKRRWFAGARA